jgi:hypothetical protein
MMYHLRMGMMSSSIEEVVALTILRASGSLQPRVTDSILSQPGRDLTMAAEALSHFCR